MKSEFGLERKKMMDRQAWEGYAEAEKYDTTWDKNFQIPYENYQKYIDCKKYNKNYKKK